MLQEEISMLDKKNNVGNNFGNIAGRDINILPPIEKKYDVFIELLEIFNELVNDNLCGTGIELFDIDKKIEVNRLGAKEILVRDYGYISNKIEKASEALEDKLVEPLAKGNRYIKSKYRECITGYEIDEIAENSQTIWDDIKRSIIHDIDYRMVSKLSRSEESYLIDYFMCYAFVKCQIFRKPEEFKER